MGQFDNPGQSGSSQPSFLDGIHLHQSIGDTPPPVSNLHLNLHPSGTRTQADVNQPVANAAPAPVRIVPMQQVAQPNPIRIIHQADTTNQPQMTAAPDQSISRPSLAPAHPAETDSTKDRMGFLVTNVAAVGSAVVFNNKFRAKIDAANYKNLDDLILNTQPETLEALKNQNTEAVSLVVEKGKAAQADVEKIAAKKPEAFQSIEEQLPPKAPNKPPEKLIYSVPKVPRGLNQEELKLSAEEQAAIEKTLSLDEDELVTCARADYLRSVEKTIVTGFNLGNTSTVSAYRQRWPYLNKLGSTEAAELEGLKEPLSRFEATSNKLMGETTEGRLALDKAAKAEKLGGFGILAAGYAATRAIDYFAYDNKSQGFLTTAFDMASPFMVMTKYNPWIKIGVMVAGHEIVRAMETNVAKHKADDDNEQQ